MIEKQPRPLRVLAAIGALATLIVGGLPAFGIDLSPEQIGVLTGIVGALSAVVVAFYGETQVTPVSSPRDSQGRRLVAPTAAQSE